MKTIKVTVGPKGGITIKTEGFSGSECERATAAAEAALGVRDGNQRTPEYFKTATAGAKAEA